MFDLNTVSSDGRIGDGCSNDYGGSLSDGGFGGGGNSSSLNGGGWGDGNSSDYGNGGDGDDGGDGLGSLMGGYVDVRFKYSFK